MLQFLFQVLNFECISRSRKWKPRYECGQESAYIVTEFRFQIDWFISQIPSFDHPGLITRPFSKVTIPEDLQKLSFKNSIADRSIIELCIADCLTAKCNTKLRTNSPIRSNNIDNNSYLLWSEICQITTHHAHTSGYRCNTRLTSQRYWWIMAGQYGATWLKP